MLLGNGGNCISWITFNYSKINESNDWKKGWPINLQERVLQALIIGHVNDNNQNIVNQKKGSPTLCMKCPLIAIKRVALNLAGGKIRPKTRMFLKGLQCHLDITHVTFYRPHIYLIF